jgi:ankyrin repeat protein
LVIAGAFPTALQLAAYQGSLSLMKLLIQKGADPDMEGGVDDDYFSSAWMLMS